MTRAATPDDPTLRTAGSASGDLVRAIVRGLYDGRYEPGQRLVEAQLTATYGISRGPVREALNMLAAMGVVDLAPQRGAQVAVLDVAEAIDILVVAQSLIGTTARLAATNISRDGAGAQMAAALAALVAFDPASAGADFAVARNSFYATLTRLAANAELSRMLPTIRIHIIRVQFRSVLRATDRSRHTDYRRIAGAVIAGQATAAEAAARLHLGRAIAALQAHGRPGGTLPTRARTR